jgi:hypothetical protein
MRSNVKTATGKSNTATMTFSVAPGRVGKLTYHYGTSTKGGTASVLVDGVSRSVSFNESSGGLKEPVFGSSIEFANLAAGQHTLEIRNMSGGVYVDRFVLESSSPTSHATSGPGATSSSSGSLGVAQELVRNISVASGATAISVVAESNSGLPIKLMVIGPTGSILQVADRSNGVASVTAPVSQSGMYVVKVVNLNLGPVQVWTAATPTVPR